MIWPVWVLMMVTSWSWTSMVMQVPLEGLRFPRPVEASTLRIEMSEKRKKYDREFREGAVRIVEETGKPITQVARDFGVNEGTLGNWVACARETARGTRGLSKDDIEEFKGLRAEVADSMRRQRAHRAADPAQERPGRAGQDRAEVPRPALGLHRGPSQHPLGG